jgi:hypothetical protein
VLRARGDANVPFAMQSLESAAPQLGVRLQTVDIASADELDTCRYRKSDPSWIGWRDELR